MTPEEKIDRVKLIIRKILLKDMDFAAICLWVPIEIGREDMNAYAYTDGKSIFFCDKFFESKEKQQMATVVHEVLHAALQHPDRSYKLRMSKGEKYNHDLANLCADAMVLRPIVHTPWLEPHYRVDVEKLVDPKVLAKIPAEKWTFEMLYNYLEPAAQALEQKIQKMIGDLIEKGGGDIELPNGKDSTEFDRQMAGRVWNERLRRAAAGTAPGSLLRGAMGDLPIPRVPWEKVLRDFMLANVMPTTTTDWTRPSRRLLASRGTLGHYEPGLQREKGVRRAGVVIDNSGSIDDDLLNRFISETNSIMEQTGCEITLMAADAEVQHTQLYRDRIPQGLKFPGGGGTDFRPALKEMEKHDVDCCIYLTDMCGTFPDKAPKFPVMWASIVPQKPPFGRYVEVDVLHG